MLSATARINIEYFQNIRLVFPSHRKQRQVKNMDISIRNFDIVMLKILTFRE